MAYLDPSEAFEHLKSRVLEGVQSSFPEGKIAGKTQTLFLDRVEVKDPPSPDDIRAQHDAKVSGATWSVPVYGHFRLQDNASGKVVDQRKVRLLELPVPTRRHSYIVKGQEWQVDNQWQLKPGAYAQRDRSGGITTQFNVVGRRSFHLDFNPETKVFSMSKYGKSKAELPIYPMLKTMGVPDSDLEKAWGKEIFDANKAVRGADKVLEKFYGLSARKGLTTPTQQELAQHLYDTMLASKMDPKATALTLGKPLESVTGEALRLSTEKLLKIQAGHPEDDRDSLVFKNLRSAGDYAFDRIEHVSKHVRDKMIRKVNGAKDIHDVVQFPFGKTVLGVFGNDNDAARNASQINPIEMVSSAMQTTIMGEGAIQNARIVSDKQKLVNPSHLGFLDPINTPEGAKTGVTLRLPIGVKKVGMEAHVRLFNIKTGKPEDVSAQQFSTMNVVLPDQVKWEHGKPVPLGKTVKASTADNQIREVPFHEAQYVMRYPAQVFNMTSNLIPFLGNTNGNRASMASRQMEQAISLKHRQNPLVQVSLGTEGSGTDTFEKLLGKHASHATPIDGTVASVHADGIVIRGSGGEKHTVQLYNNFPLNDPKSVMHSTPIVAVGDKVHKGQTIADTNFSKGGVLALGTNLRVGYLPYKGYNFEDGIVISKSAAEKLSSEHLTKPDLKIDPQMIFDKSVFLAKRPGQFSKAQLDKLDDKGIIRVGQKVREGDPLIAVTKPYLIKDRVGMKAIRRSMSGAHDDKSLSWDSHFEGTVAAVHQTPEGIRLHVKTTEPMQVGDKMAGRYGNKGIVTQILEDHEMPHTKDGKHIEVALNPSGIPGRMNVGQVLEVAAAKIAEKTGKPYIVKNFEAEVDNLGRIQGELKQHGLSDTEELFDPVTKQSLGKTMVGPQHMFKLVHQIEKKLSVRSGMGNEGYDSNLQPSKGGHTGGQNIGTLGLYAMLAHGATANIREMQSYKAQGEDPQTDPKKKFHSEHNFIWSMLQTGQPLPTPKPTFAFEKFRGYLKAAGVNMEKQGHDLVLAPMTDAQIRTLAPHALTNAADILNVKVDKKTGDFKPRPGSLFDERATGGLGGTRWSRIELAEPLPNPMFEGPIRHLTGLTESDFESIVHGERGVNPAGKLTTPDAGVTGGGGIKILLDRVNTKKELELAQAALTTAPRAKVDGALKKVKYLRALDKLGITASDAYMLHNLPVLPPSLRPAQRLPAGNALQIEDMNRLYANFAALNDKLGNPILKRSLADADKAALRKDYYSKAGEGLRSVMGVGGTYESAGKNKGLLHYIAGKDPKTGFFQSRLVNRRQDLTMRSTIIPEPAMGLDQVGLPREAALKLFRPFVVRKLKEMGSIRNQMEAADYIDKKGPDVWKALDRVMVDHPVLLKRDPALHKFSVQAFMPKAVAGEAIQIHPLTVTGFNADFDGDTMSVYVPITHEAKAEARNMLPSKNLFSEATGKIVFQPTLESALGLYKLSLVGKETGKAYKHPGEVLEAVRKGSADVTDVVQLNGKKTTAGRILLSSALPEDEHGKEPLQSNMLHKLDTRINDKGLTKLMTTLAKEHSGIYGEHVNRLKDLGNGASFGVIALPSTKSPFVLGKAEGTNAAVADKTYLAIGTHTLSLEDFVADKKNRDPILKKTHAEVEKIYANKKIPMGERDRQAVELYVKAGDEIQKKHEAGMEKDPSNLFTMYRAGVKPNWTAYKQMVIAPMIVKDSSNRDVPTPVTKSYSEGLDIGGYWTQMHGARRGAVMKVQEVEKPGYTSKLLLNNLMSTVVDQHNCGTGHGVALDVTENDVHDRYLAQEFKHGPMQVPAGELLTTDLVSKIRSAKPNATIVVRSPLKCESDKGVCQTCAGLDASGKKHDLGTNIGIQAGHAIGERIVQLILKEFHTGGVKQSGREGRSLGFTRFQQLVNLPKNIPDQSTLAKTSGTITRVQPTATGVDVFIGNKPHHVGKDTSGMPLHTRLPNEHLMGGYIPWHPPVAGMHVEAGTELSDPNRTLWNARSYYGITHSMEKTQGRLTDEIYDLYKSSGVRRRSVETLVRTMGNLTKVDDPGDHPEILRGEYRPLTQVNNLNHALMKEGKKPIEHSPVLEGITSLPHDMHDDWIAEMQHDNLRTTMMDAAATGRPSRIHGPHPIPGVVFGAEFGLTSKDSKKPGLAHLSTVPEHHY